jgi:hypothetical protein
MYQSNQARIKKEIPSLLLGRGQRLRGQPSLALAALAHEQYCSAMGTVEHNLRHSPQLSTLNPNSRITSITLSQVDGMRKMRFKSVG